jgi:flagellar biosynthesis protein FliR
MSEPFFDPRRVPQEVWVLLALLLAFVVVGSLERRWAEQDEARCKPVVESTCNDREGSIQ